MNISDLIKKYQERLPKRLPSHEKKIFNASIMKYEQQFNIRIVNIRHFIHLMVNEMTSSPKCPVCDGVLNWNIGKSQYNDTCSISCSNVLVNRWKNRTDVDKQRSTVKRKQTNMLKYNHTNYLASDEGKQQIHTILGKRGVVNPSQLEEVQIKKRYNSLLKHGVSHPSKIQRTKEKIKQANMHKFGRESWAQLHISTSVLSKLNDKEWLTEQHHAQQQSIPMLAKQLGVWDTTIASYLNKHNIDIKRYFCSVGQNEIVDFLKSCGVDNILVNDRTTISPYELDILLPDYNIAIEYNGLFWHSEIFKSSNYHVDKTTECERKHIRLIHIFEDEWRDQQQQCKETLTHLIGKTEKGTYARNTYIKEIPWKQAKEFLERYHLLKSGSCGNYRIGSFDKNDNLIGVMVFGNQNNEHSNVDEVELRRFVTNKKNNPGLGSKMFKYAVTQNNYKQVVAFVDRRWFTGLVKDHIGFAKVGETPPSIWWTDGKKRFHRRFMTKQQLTKIDNLEKCVTKRQMLKELGFVRIHDCGKIKLRWINEFL